MEPRHLLRLEGVAAFALALGSYLALDGPLWLLAVLALAPDLSMAAYLAGPRAGSYGYNVTHTYTVPLALAGLAVWTDSRLALLVALVWVGHIGADRTLGYGLKYATGFPDTHLGGQTPPVDALAEE